MSLDIGRPGNFEVEGEASVVATAWLAWIEEFDCYADCKGLFNPSGTSAKETSLRRQRQALLLFCGGPRVREVLKNHNDSIEEVTEKCQPDDYDGTIQILNAHFLVKPNKRFMRHVFRQMRQTAGETIAQYVGRLRKGSVGCEYVDVNDSIVDQIVSGCYYDALRKNFLESGATLDLKS